MKRLFRAGGSAWGDVTLAAAALGVSLVMISIALTTVWFPFNPGEYIFVAAFAAACWPASRLAPRLTLLIAGCVVGWPWWWFDVPELRLLPLIIVAFRCAVAGVSPFLVGAVGAAGAVTALIPGVWTSVSNLAQGYESVLIVVDPSRLIMTIVVFDVVVVLGYTIRVQRRSATELRDRNEQLVALRDVDRERVAEQVRTAIARDMHDVVAHHISAMVIRAQAADRVAEVDPGQLRGAVRAVAAEGSEALASMRRLVHVLNESDHRAAVDDRPSFGEAVERMAARLRDGGIEVDVASDTGGSPEFVEAAVLPIIQEALTNVMLHADATRVTVALAPRGHDLELIVSDDGRAGSSPGTGGGHGVRGMSERAAALGGSLTSRPHPDGGWQVRARLPRNPAPARS
ncbi:sensor histidine kinase [Microbacterium sp. P07]|uniref:sensor histidine kinase n=1 Tax=Microbacterium sp. P07 TaxID=3366952 RepID=UPI003745776F